MTINVLTKLILYTYLLRILILTYRLTALCRLAVNWGTNIFLTNCMTPYVKDTLSLV